jgi:hypothetical protein
MVEEASRTYVQRPKTYSGLLDDVVQRYPLNEQVAENFFNKSILKNVFFSSNIILNDGYLANHPAARAGIMNENSILHKMLEKGFVNILARDKDNPNLTSHIYTMANSGNIEYQKTLNLNNWSEIERKLNDIAPYLIDKKYILPWPNKKMHLGFNRIIQNIFNKTHNDLGLFYSSDISLDKLNDLYMSYNPSSGNPRHCFEEAVKKITEHHDKKNLAQNELMNLANQAYHYNFAMCLSDMLGQPVVADTTIGEAFEDLLDFDDSLEIELMDMPLIDIPNNAISLKGHYYYEILNPMTKVGLSKLNFLNCVEEIFNNKDTLDNRKKVLEEAADEYRARLAEHFSGRGVTIKRENFFGNLATTVISFGFSSISSAFAVAAPIAGLAVKFASSANQPRRLLDEFLYKSIRRKITEVTLKPVGEDNSDYMRLRLRDVRPRFASLAFNSDKVKDHVSNVPSFGSES